MNVRNGRLTPVQAAFAVILAAGIVGGASPAFGQIGARGNVERQLGLRRGGEEPATPNQAAQPEAGGPEDDVKKIATAKTVEELMELGKTFVLSQKQDSAAAAVEKIIARKPELLEDAQKQTPKSWNDFWFTHRAKMREKRLTPKDAAGRAKIALWLHEAGLTGAARAMLTTALAINKNEPAVKELAEKWNVLGGGPVRFDLSCGLKEPLIAQTIQDEGQTVSPRSKERVFLILPIAYNAGNLRLMINKGDITAVSDDGKPCSVTGLVLMDKNEAAGSGSGQSGDPLAGRGQVAEVKMPTGSEPLWEQMQIQPVAGQPAEGQSPQHEVVLKNIMHPIVRPAPGQGRGAAPPAPVDRSNQPSQVTKPSTGYAAFILEVPQAAKTVECSYKKGETQVTLDIEFLKVLSKPVENLQGAERERLMSAMAGQAMAKSAPVASAALRKLNAIRLIAGKGQGTSDAVLKPSPTVEKVEKVLLAALGHENPQVRRDAFDLLYRDSSEEFDELVAGAADASVLGNLVGEAKAYFIELREARAATETTGETAGSNPPPGPSGEATPTGLPPLPGGPGLERILIGCLKCKHAPVREEAVDIVLTNPFQQTVGALESAGDEAVGQLLARVPKVEDVKVKQAILAVLMKRPPSRQLAEILKVFSDTPVVIGKEDDPILEMAMREGQPAEVQRLVLETLARADLSAIAASDKLRKLIELLSSGEIKTDGKVGEAMLKLARSQLKAGYEAPIKRANQSGGQQGPQGPVGFDSLLASVAVAPKTDTQTARQAAATLLGLGQVRGLTERLKAAQGAEARVQDWIQNLARDKNLTAREALPVFVAGQLAATDPKTVQLAVTALSAIQKSSDSKGRWKVNLAIKQGLEAKQLVTLASNEKETISRPALALLRDLSGMTAAEAAEFEGLPDESARQEKLNTLEQNRSTKAVGALACMVYLDVRANPNASAAQPGGRPAAGMERSNVPLTSSMVTFQRAAKDGQVRVIADGVPIGPPDKRQGEQSSASPGSVSINASALLRAALNSPEAKKEGLAGKINPASLRAPLICELKYEQLGAWGGEVTLQDTGDASSSEFPLKLVGAKVLLEPMTQ